MHNTIESSTVFGLLPFSRAPLFSSSVAIKSMWFSGGKDQKNLDKEIALARAERVSCHTTAGPRSAFPALENTACGTVSSLEVSADPT